MQSSTTYSANPFSGFEARRINSEITRTEFILRGGRFHLFLLSDGAATLVTEEGQHGLKPPSVCWLPNGASRTLRMEAGSSGMMLSIPDSFLGRSVPTDIMGNQVRQIIGHIHHFQNVEPQSYDSILHHMQLAERELAGNAPGMGTVLQNTVSSVLVELWRHSGAEFIQPLALPRNLVHTFMSLLDVHLRDHWTVAQYAGHMGVSRDRLTSVLRRATGETPLTLIHQKMIAEAKSLLVSSNQQVSEIAFTLGYNDPAYFIRFFQRHMDETPARYRRSNRKRDLNTRDSYADWP